MKSVPCWICKGEGSWVEPVLDYGEGPEYTCGLCKGAGMIEIGGPLHQQYRRECMVKAPKKRAAEV